VPDSIKTNSEVPTLQAIPEVPVKPSLIGTTAGFIAKNPLTSLAGVGGVGGIGYLAQGLFDNTSAQPVGSIQSSQQTPPHLLSNNPLQASGGGIVGGGIGGNNGIASLNGVASIGGIPNFLQEPSFQAPSFQAPLGNLGTPSHLYGIDNGPLSQLQTAINDYDASVKMLEFTNKLTGQPN
jgi:hypothetical protein